MNGKCIREPDVQPQQLPKKEFTKLSVDVAHFPEQNMRYKTVTARHVAESALLLLNHPFAIKEQPTLQPTSNKFEVAAIHAKNGRVQCTVNTNFVSCNCPRYKFDNTCTHSIAVPQFRECLEELCRAEIQSSLRVQGKREAEIKKNIVPKNNRAQQLKFLKATLMTFIQSCITIIIPLSFAFFPQRQSNAKPAKWTSVTGIYRHLPRFAHLLAWFMLTCTVCLTCFTFCMN